MNQHRISVRGVLRLVGPVIGLVVVWGLFAAAIGDRFWSWDNQRLMLLQTAVVGTAAVGATIVIISGGIDLSVGSAIALMTVVVALLLNAGVPPLLAALGGVVAGGAVGWLIGAFVVGSILRVPLSPFIVTLAMWGALRGLAKGLGDNQPVYLEEDPWLLELMVNPDGAGTSYLPAPGVFLMLVVAVCAAVVLRFTRFGRHVFAIGSNEQTARLCGVPVERTKLGIYTLATACAGLAGLLQLGFVSMGDPTTAEGYELKVIASVVIGGASLTGGEGSILGTLVGALIMTVVDNGCTKLGLENWVQEIVTGCIILIAVFVDRLRHRRSV